MPERAVAGTPAATKIPSYKVHTGHSVRSKCSNRRRALSTNYSSCSARCAARARRTRAHRPEYVRTYGAREFTAPPRRVQQLFRSFREANISSATRRERERESETPHLVSYATIDLGRTLSRYPESQGAVCIRTRGVARRERRRGENGSTCDYIDSSPRVSRAGE